MYTTILWGEYGVTAENEPRHTASGQMRKNTLIAVYSFEFMSTILSNTRNYGFPLSKSRSAYHKNHIRCFIHEILPSLLINPFLQESSIPSINSTNSELRSKMRYYLVYLPTSRIFASFNLFEDVYVLTFEGVVCLLWSYLLLFRLQLVPLDVP